MTRRVLLVLLLLSLAGLPAAAAPLQVVTTTTDLADAVRNVGGDRVEVQAICPGYQNPHSVQTRPSYLLLLQRADAFIQTGLDLEVAWAPDLLRNARNPAILPGAQGFLDASTGITVLQKPVRVDRTQGDVHPLGNPHYTLNPDNMKIVARTVTAFLKRLDPAGSGVYDEGYKKYWYALDAADKGWKQKLAPFKGAPVVTYHNSWPYFARHFGLEVVGYVEPRPGISPSAAHLDQLGELMKQRKVKVILMETWFPDHISQELARKTGARVLRLPILPGGVRGADTYIQMMDYIVGQLAGSL
ncbi:MAG TPA: metal ABC transporter substrate-binding protein [Candidatus Nitrosotenuis sp.]|jgi:ABC-type Zn uptake system ZnuABC Zn-binding protein ZnuA|nr:metal ABC transporter substrate-binding protein [Candidatus Nitrosotenuis sp.]